MLSRLWPPDLMDDRRYLINCLRDNQSLDLLVLKELLARMGGVDTIEEMSVAQINGRAGGDTLRAEMRHSVAPLRRSLSKLRDALLRKTRTAPQASDKATDGEEDGGGDETKAGETAGGTGPTGVAPLALPMMVLIAQQRDHLVYHTDTKHVKLIGYLTDQCQMVLGQFLEFQQQHLEPSATSSDGGDGESKEGGSSNAESGEETVGEFDLVPPLETLREWHVPPEIRCVHVHPRQVRTPMNCPRVVVAAPLSRFSLLLARPFRWLQLPHQPQANARNVCGRPHVGVR